MTHHFPRSPLVAFAMALLGLAGCRDKSIATYRIPKEPDAPPEAVAAAATSTPAAASGLHWTAPSGWQQQAASDMRIGSFTVPGSGGASADVSVISFGGTGGDDLANVNRWRGQVHLPPVAADAMASLVEKLTTAAGAFSLVDLGGTSDAGATPQRILGAWLRQAGKVWFFKMIGPANLVGSQKDNFVAFLKSVTAGSDGRVADSPAGGAPSAGDLPVARPGAGANTNDLPRSMPAASAPPEAPMAGPMMAPGAGGPPMAGGMMGAMPVATDNSTSLVWQAPADWQNKPGNAMRKGTYAAGAAEIAITAFPSDVGGVLMNVNRWRGQVGLGPIDEAGLGKAAQPLDANGLHFTVVDTGSASPGGQRILAALLPLNGGTWFFKLTGPEDAVAKAEPEFREFLKTVKAP